MQIVKWLVVLVTLILIGTLFFPWVSLESRGIEVGGFHSKGTDVFGKPGIFHLFLALLFLVFILLDKIWSKRIAYFIGALHIAWAVRNFSLISACNAGECPEKHAALYIMLVSAIAALIIALFIPDRNAPAS